MVTKATHHRAPDKSSSLLSDHGTGVVVGAGVFVPATVEVGGGVRVGVSVIVGVMLGKAVGVMISVPE